MPQYLLSVWGPEMTAEQQAEYMKSGAFEATGKLNDELVASGNFVFANGLEPLHSATVVRANDNGDVVVTDGPYVETKEYMGGFWVLECADLDEALAIAKRATVACQGPVEVRPFQSEPPVSG
ncbi:MAG: hypothetical protein QOG90_43 [Actinomycetota bacterium]